MNGQLERLIQLQKMNPDVGIKSDSRVVSFTSGKGGTGKTVISLNAAVALSRMNKKVLYIDKDFNFSNAHILLNRIVPLTLGDFYNGTSSLTEIVSEISESFHFIAGTSDSGKMPDTNSVRRFFLSLRQFSNEYDFIIIDTASGAADITTEVLKHSDVVFIVTTPEPTSVMDSYVMIKLLMAAGKKSSVRVLINKCRSESDATETSEKLCTAVNHFLKFDPAVVGHINFDERIYQSVIDQELLINNHKDSPAVLQIQSFVNHLIENKQLANILHR